MISYYGRAWNVFKLFFIIHLQEVQRKTGVREVLAISALKDQGIKELRTHLINYSLIDE